MRLMVSSFLAAAFTLMLFYAMQSLINNAGVQMDEIEGGYVLDFVRIKDTEKIEVDEENNTRLPNPQAPPPMPDQMDEDRVKPGQLQLNLSGVNISNQLDIGGGIGFDNIDGDYLPLVKVAPTYPRRALRRGLEGWVIIEFTVDKTGKVVDPIVVESNPPNVFDNAALKAVLKFKYKPRVVDDKPVAVAGVQHKISFNLQK